MRKVLILCLLVVFAGLQLWAQTCPMGDIVLTSQQEIDDFAATYPGCTSLPYNLTIRETIPGNITNLSGLSQLTEVAGYVFIDANTSLTNLSGLDNLTAIYSYLALTNNASIVDLTGLESLTHITGDLRFVANMALSSLSGLNALTTVGSEINIINNNNLNSLTGLENLVSIGRRLMVLRNDALTNLAGLSSLDSIGTDLEILDNDGMLSLIGMEQLTHIGGHIIIDKNSELETLEGLEGISVINQKLEITSNNSLINLTGLDNLTSIAAYFILEYNASLTSLSALSNLIHIAGLLQINNNNDLTDLHGLEGLTNLGALWIISNTSLTSLSGLDNLTSIDGSLQIWNHIQLPDLTGLGTLESIGGYCSILTNQNMESLAGLESLTSVGDYLWISNASLESLSALSNLSTIGGYFKLSGNNDLTNLQGTENIDFTDTDYLDFLDNPLLAVCGQENICDYIVTGGNVILSGNAEGCNEIGDLLQNCFADSPHKSLVGRVIADTDLSCTETNDEEGIAGWLVEVSSATFNYAVSTDSQGYYWLPVLLGDYTLNAISPSAFWVSCFTDTLLQVTTLGDSITTDFFLQPHGNCPFIDWDVTIPPLRVCQTRTITVDYCNNGALPAEDVIFTVTLDPVLTIDGASLPYTEDANGVLFFDLETLDLFECGQFTIDVFLACEGVEIGDFPCVEVSLLSDELCAPDPLWDGSLITANGYCENDSIYFQLENIGAGGMSVPAQLRVEIVIDDIILMLEADEYQLPAGATQVLQYEVQGEGLRLEADQTPGHPVYTEVSAVVANCNSTSDGSFVMQLPINDGDPFSGVFCAPAVNSYDPNIKTALPTGIGPEHLIDKDWTLNYMIQFQNTGNDVAYEVVITDTLSEALDLSSLHIKGASHPFTWTLTPERALTFTFADILLPDSTTNEPGSHGFVEFSIRPETGILPATVIENTAHIYFDLNEAIVTNTVDHTIRKPVVASSKRLDWCAGEAYNGLPILQDTSVQFLVSFAEYDSIHFVHFKVSETAFSVDLEIPVGEYFQDILITNDTSITIGYVAVNGCDSLVTYSIDVLTSTNRPDAFADTQVYPNPVRSELKVMHQQNGSSQTWTLFNSMGQVCWQEQLQPYQTLNPIAMSKYPSGIYCLQVKTERGTRSWKVLRVDG